VGVRRKPLDRLRNVEVVGSNAIHLHDATPVHRRLLGNGHCTRPRELDYRFQTICEGCGFFETGTEFVTILRRQRDDATAHDDLAWTKLYEELVKVIDEREAPSTP
jgi:hypothetical protein